MGLTLVWLSVGASAASAGVNNYCGYIIYKDQWCHDGIYRNYYWNSAREDYSPAITVYVRFRRYTDGAVLYRYWDQNYVETPSGLNAGYRTAEVAHSYSDPDWGNTFTVYGRALYLS